MPHRLGALLDPRRDEDDLPRGSDLDNAAGRLALERLASDDVFSFACLRIALPVADVTREDDVFDVEDADFVIVQLIGCVKGNKVLAISDLGPKTINDPGCHEWPILPRYSRSHGIPCAEHPRSAAGASIASPGLLQRGDPHPGPA